MWEGFQWALDTVATIGSIPRPRNRPGGADRQGPAHRAGRRYALLRPGDGDGGLRRRPPRRPARRAPDPQGHRSHSATTTSSAASAAWAARSRATCAPPGPATWSSTRCPTTASWPRGSACASSRARPPTTRSCAPPGSCAPAAVIACVDSDAENIFITLTARELRPDMAIVARAASEDSESKLLRAGADARHLAVQVQRIGDGALRAEPAGVGRGRRRARVPHGGDRGARRAARASARRSPTSGEVRSSSACAPPTARSIPSRPRRPS